MAGASDQPDRDFEPRGVPPQRDAFGIRHALLLTAGVAVGLVFFVPRNDGVHLDDAEWCRGIANALLIGLALPAPLFCIPRGARRSTPAPGAMFALTAGLGVLLMLPAEVMVRLKPIDPISRDSDMPMACLYWVLPLLGLWYLLAALVSCHINRKLFSSESPWTERYGFLLALLWSPLGVWLLVEIYRGVLP